MAEQQTKEVVKRKIKVKNISKRGNRFVFVDGEQKLIGPGQEVEVEVSEAEAKRLEEQSKAGSDLNVGGHEPEKAEADPDAPEIPKEHENRVALAEAERDLMEEGQEADKERREKAAKMSGEQLAASTGIHMHARGLKPEVVASPPDAPPKKADATAPKK